MFEKAKQDKEDWRAALADFDLRGMRTDQWSESIFQESYEALLKESNAHNVLLSRYVDARHLAPGQEFSRYEDRFSMRPLEGKLNLTNEWRQRQLTGGSTDEFVEPKHAVPGHEATRLPSTQYGPTRVCEVAPNQFVFIPWEKFSKNDVLGSDRFSACSAVIVKTETGFLFAHVTTGAWGAKQFIEKAREKFPTGKIILVRPEWRTAENEVNQEYESGWASIDPTVSQIKYPYIAVNSFRSAGVDETSVVLSLEKISTIGVENHPKGRQRFLPETKNDFSW